jgi:predicted nucleic acid-binding protein
MAISQAALWSDVFEVAPTSASTVSKAAAVVSRHKLQVWDAVVMVAAQEAGASVLYSEDMQDGAILAGVQIVNPFVMSDAAFASLIP